MVALQCCVSFLLYSKVNQSCKAKVKVTQLCPTLCDPMDCPWNSLGQNTGVGSLSLLQGIFPTQGSNPGLLNCRRILYQLSHQGSPQLLSLCSKAWEPQLLKPERPRAHAAQEKTPQ